MYYWPLLLITLGWCNSDYFNVEFHYYSCNVLYTFMEPDIQNFDFWNRDLLAYISISEWRVEKYFTEH